MSDDIFIKCFKFLFKILGGTHLKELINALKDSGKSIFYNLQEPALFFFRTMEIFLKLVSIFPSLE